MENPLASLIDQHADEPEDEPEDEPDQVLVCGLGSLGQHCVVMLKEFGVRVSAIELTPPDHWEIAEVPHILSQLWVGDCRRTEILSRAHIQACRAALLVTSNDRVNIEAAFAVRLLNPKVRLVVRSDKQNLSQLLEQHVGNFVAFEPTQLAASAFALAALDQDILGFFNVDDQLLKVIQHRINPSDRWCDIRRVHELSSRSCRVLGHWASSYYSDDTYSGFARFHDWNPNTIVRAGDRLITIEESQRLVGEILSEQNRPLHPSNRQRVFSLFNWTVIKQRLIQFFQQNYRHQIRRVAIACAIIILSLLSIGTLLYRLHYPELRWSESFFTSAILLLGGFGDLFDDFEMDAPIPGWLKLFSLGLTVAGTAFVGVLYAMLIDGLLTMRLNFLSRRPPLPQNNHVIVIGLGRIGQQVTNLLQELKQPLVGLMPGPSDPTLLPHIPVVFGDLGAALEKVNIASAKSVVAVTGDEMQNLEMGLMVYANNPNRPIVIRTYDQQFSDYVAQLFPYAQVLCASELSAEAFVAAAFGENILSLFRLDQQTILVTEYEIEANDTLHQCLLAEISYGYEVVPIYYRRVQTYEPPHWMPSDDIRLEPGDRLVVLATSEGLRRIEQGDMLPRQWQVTVEKALNRSATFDGAAEISLITGCSLHDAREVMEHLPATVPISLFEHQAMRLVRRLRRTQVVARIQQLQPHSNSDRLSTGHLYETEV